MSEFLPPIFALNKPLGPSSNQVLTRLRGMLGKRKIGYAGTLDPLAEGVLVVAIGREHTKRLRHILEQEKEYIATVRFGLTSATDDEEGEKAPVETPAAFSPPSAEEIRAILPEFTGTIWQLPPKFSAIKAGGRPAYHVARAGGEPLLGKRQVDIYGIEILAYEWPLLKIRVACGSGTYIRSLARDLGERFGCGAYLAGLVRTRVGEYTLERAYTLEEIAARYAA